MKKLIYTLLFTFIFGAVSSDLVAQSFQIQLIKNDYGYLAVQMRETSGTGTPTTSTDIGDISLEIRWLTSLSTDVAIICSDNDYNLADALGSLETSGSYSFRLFQATNTPFNPPLNWVQNEWTTLAVFQATSGSGAGDFEIGPHTFGGYDLNWNQDGTDYEPAIIGNVSSYSYPTIVYDYVWVGGVSGPGASPTYWNQTSNWSDPCGNAPSSGFWPYQITENVCIPDVSSGSNVYPDSFKSSDGYSYTCKNLLILDGAQLTVPDLSGNIGTSTYFNIANDAVIDGKLYISPMGHVTVTSNTTINSAEGIEVQATNEGSGSFINNGTITYGGSGTAKVQTYLSNNQATGFFEFHLVGPTIANATLENFNASQGNTYAYDYVVASDTWDNIFNNVSVPTSKGIGISTDNGNSTINMTGELKTDIISSPQMSISGNGYNLLSNPYPSSIFWDDLYSNNSNVNDQVYVYDGTNYLVYNQGTGGTDEWTGYIQVGQGFFVEATSATAFAFHNGDRHHSSNPFYKSGDFTNRLDVRVTGNESTDGLLVHFYESAISGYEPNEDASKKMSYSENATQFWTVLDDGQQMSINAMPLELLGKGIQSVPMSFICSATAEYTMNFLDIESFEFGTEIWLEDIQTGAEWISINDNPDYTFTATPEDIEERFVIHFFGPTGVSEFEIENTIDIFSYRQNAFVRNNTNEVIKSVNIYTLAGKLLQSNNPDNIKLSKFWVSENLGYYVVRVITNENVYTNKILITK